MIISHVRGKVFVMIHFLLVFGLLIYFSNSCQDVALYSKVAFKNTDAQFLTYHNIFYIIDGNETYQFYPNSLTKELVKNLPKHFSRLARKIDSRTCINNHGFQLCGVNSSLSGCGLLALSDEESTGIDCQKLVLNTPVVYLSDKNGTLEKKKIGYQLTCYSHDFEYLTFDEFHFMIDSGNGSLFALLSTHMDDDSLRYGVCELKIQDIYEMYKNENTIIHIQNESRWLQMTMSQFLKSNFSNGFILNNKPKHSLFDIKFGDKVINHFNMSNFKYYDNQTYHIFYYITSDQKLVKVEFGHGIHKIQDLYCNFDSEISEFIILNDQSLLVVTHQSVYALKPYVCNASLTCSSCVQLKDLHCFWDQNLEKCEGITKINDIQNISRVKQDIWKGSDQICLTDNKELDFKSISNKLDNIMEKMKNEKDNSNHKTPGEDCPNVEKRLQNLENEVQAMRQRMDIGRIVPLAQTTEIDRDIKSTRHYPVTTLDSNCILVNKYLVALLIISLVILFMLFIGLAAKPGAFRPIDKAISNCFDRIGGRQEDGHENINYKLNRPDLIVDEKDEISNSILLIEQVHDHQDVNELIDNIANVLPERQVAIAVA